MALVGICAAFSLAREASRVLSDTTVLDEGHVSALVMSVPGVVGCHHIRTRGSADHALLDLHVWAARDMRLDDAHGLSHVVKDRLLEKYPQLAGVIKPTRGARAYSVGGRCDLIVHRAPTSGTCRFRCAAA